MHSAARPRLSRLIGSLVFGYGVGGLTYRPSVFGALATAVLQYGFQLGGVDVLAGLASAKGGGEVQALESFAIAQIQPEAYLHDPRFSVWGFVNEPWMI